MQRALLAAMTCLCLLLPPFLAGAADPASVKSAEPPRQESPDDGTVAEALKAALAVAAERSVTTLAKPDGYFANQSIRIGVPGELEHLPPYFRDPGFQAQVNAFILSLNRAAEMAAPKAAPLFSDAIRRTVFVEPRQVLNGGATVATDYFRKANADKLANAFRPAVIAGMREAGVLKAYREMMLKYDYESVATFPVDEWRFDMEGYLTDKALDGLFTMMGEEEKKIRSEPAARTTELLRKVFGKGE
jgi:Protein of unknown function (DUF4197)